MNLILYLIMVDRLGERDEPEVVEEPELQAVAAPVVPDSEAVTQQVLARFNFEVSANVLGHIEALAKAGWTLAGFVNVTANPALTSVGMGSIKAMYGISTVNESRFQTFVDSVRRKSDQQMVEVHFCFVKK